MLKKDFIWGCATSSYQIEGAASQDGRTPSIWDTFSHQPGNVFEDENADTSCDHYHRYKEDIRLLDELGVDAYRFSISWSRVLPALTQKSKKGLDFYNRLVDELLEKNILPFITLYHWDLPQYLQDKGGWEQRDTAYHFVDYARTMFDTLGDRVDNWITLNEPWCSAVLGHMLGTHAPGKTDIQITHTVIHHLLLAHGLAMQALRSELPNAQGGITVNPFTPLQGEEGQEHTEALESYVNFHTCMYLDPIYGRGYPQKHLSQNPTITLPIKDGDMDIIASPTDFIGVNYYTEQILVAPINNMFFAETLETSADKTEMGWDVVPDGLLRQLHWINNRYAPKTIYITENGAAFNDLKNNDRVKDSKRVDYIQKHISKTLQSAREGVPVRGYFLWSLLDNFEWDKGYSKRFGIVYCDYSTLERTKKDSFFSYKQLILEHSSKT